MALGAPASLSDPTAGARVHLETHAPGVSWSAVCGGTLVMASLSLVLLALGAGFGLSTLSPWSESGADIRTLGAATIAWLVAMQIIAGAMGGYVAGRLRGRWTRIHRDEVFFRDTAHGFLAWALAVVVTGAFLASAATRMVGARESAASLAPVDGPVGSYYSDMFFRSDRPIPAGVDDAVQRAEAHRILTEIVATGTRPGPDTSYLTEIVSQRTGLNATDAATRVSDVIQQAQQAADVVRTVTSRILLWAFVALLCGAFSASVAATIGGRQRDRVTTI